MLKGTGALLQLPLRKVKKDFGLANPFQHNHLLSTKKMMSEKLPLLEPTVHTQLINRVILMFFKGQLAHAVF